MGDDTGGGAFGLQLIRLQNDGVWTSRVGRFHPFIGHELP
jgi:hypothetical protein